MAVDVTGSMVMYLGNKVVNIAYLGSKQTVVRMHPILEPLTVEFLAVAGGEGGNAGNGIDGGNGGRGGGSVSGSFTLTPTDVSASLVVGKGGLGSVRSPAGPAGSGDNSTITFQLTQYIGYATQGGAKGNRATYSPTSLCSNGGAGIVWYDGNKYGPGGGGGAAYLVGGNCSAGAGSYGIGGGGTDYLQNFGGDGTNGVVKFRYLGSGSKATGGTISYDGTYTIHTFTTGSGIPAVQTFQLGLV